MKSTVRNLIIGLIAVIVLAMILLRGDQLVELWETVRKGAIVPLLGALATQLGKYFTQSFAYARSFHAVGARMMPRSTLPLVFGTFFMDTIAPSFNVAGTTLVVDDARRRGIDPGKATSAAVLMQLTIDSGFAVVMVVGLVILAAVGSLSPLWLVMGLLVMAIVGGSVLILTLGRMRPAVLARVLGVVERLVDRVRARFRRPPLKPWARRMACSFSDAAELMVRNPGITAQAFGFSLVASLFELACFSLVGLGFGVQNPVALICGYVVATMFAMISVTPQGVGVVEAAVLVAFSSFGVSGAAGMAIVLVYRGIVFWLPFLIGAVLIQTTKALRRR